MCANAIAKWASVKTELGESPVWDERTGTLYFVDITDGKIHALQGNAVPYTLYESHHTIGALALTQAGNLIFAEGARVTVFDLKTRQIVQMSAAISAEPHYRFNDGACDPRGRFVTGLMDESHRPESGQLFSFDTQLAPTLLYGRMGLPNGLVWNHEGNCLYFVDSVARQILKADYSLAAGTLSNITMFTETPAHLGRPDGLAMDVEGGIWVCQFNGACLLRYNAYGELIEQLSVPVPRPTSCCFGGVDMKTLFITSARFGMRADELERYPDAGGLFAVRLSVAGSPRHRFKPG